MRSIPAPAAGGRSVALALGLGSLGVYLWLAGPTFYWLDSSELVAATWGLGVAHPPGHPLATLLGRLVCYLPLGTIAFRVTLASALQTALATALVFRVAELVASETLDLGGLSGRGDHSDATLRRRRRLVRAACAVAALTAGLSYALVLQAVRAEVYALNTLLLLAGVLQLLHWHQRGDRRRLIAAGLIAGLALCNHHLLVALALPAAGVFVLWRRPAAAPRRPAVVALLLAAVLGLSTFAYLPLRASRDPRVGWGTPTTLSRFAWVVSARLFMRTPGRVARQQPLGDRAAGVGFALMGALGPAAALASLAGLYFLWRKRTTRQVAALLTLLVLGNLVSPLLVGFDPFNPDAYGYLSVAVVFGAVALAAFVAVVLDALAGIRPALAYALALAALFLPARQTWAALPRADLRRHWDAEVTARAQLDQPHGALLLTSYFETAFNLWALRETADARPDLAVLHRNFARQPGYLARMARREPGLAAAIARFEAAGRVALADLRPLARRRPVRVEYDLNVSAPLAAQLRPSGGLLLALAPDGTPAGAAKALGAHRSAVARWRAALGRPLEHETRRAVLWTHFLLARYACTTDRRALGAAHLAAARALAPKDRQIAELAARCANVRARGGR